MNELLSALSFVPEDFDLEHWFNEESDYCQSGVKTGQWKFSLYKDPYGYQIVDFHNQDGLYFTYQVY